VINVVYDSHELAQSCVALMEVGPRSHTGRYCFVAGCPLWAKSEHRSKCHCFFRLMHKLRGLNRLIARVCRAAALVAATLYSRIASFRLFSDHRHSKASDISVIHHLDGRAGPKSNCEEEKKMNKQMTPAEIEVLQQSFARFAPLSEKATLVGIESGPLPPPNVPAALALAGMTMK